MPQTRQLAAIMFTDIVGYTALMGKDEQKAFDILRKNRELQRPLIEQYNGRWIKELGDGVLASFTTVSDAVQAAIQIQQKCNQSKEFSLRIGIHQGEVVFEGEDIFGDAVNIASRIQALAPIGGIWISETVHHNVSNKQSISTQFIKEERLKNVTEPVRIYEVQLEGTTASITTTEVNKRSSTSFGKKPFNIDKPVLIALAVVLLVAIGYFIYIGVSKTEKNTTETKAAGSNDKSIAVLYFDNMSGDPAQDYFSDGITEEIITKLSHLSNLRVISRTSVLPYKGKGKNIKDIARELNCNTILEGSVRKAGNKVRITAQLIDAEMDKHLWSQIFERELIDIFEIQSSVAESIAKKFNVFISPQAHLQITHHPTENVEAYDLYLQAKAIAFMNTGIGVGNPSSNRSQATVYLRKAIALDSSFSEALALLSEIQINVYYTVANSKNMLDSATVLAKRAIEHNPNGVDGYIALARTFEARNKESALNTYQTLYRIDPSLGLWEMGNFFYRIGNFVEAMKCFSQKVRLEPNKVEGYLGKAILYCQMGQQDSAKRYFSKAKSLDPNNKTTHLWEMSFYEFKGADDETKRAAKLVYGDDTAAYNKEVAIAYLFKKDWGKAEEYYRRTAYRDMDYGLVLWKTNRKDSARYYFQNAINYRKQLAYNYGMDLSRIYAVLGNKGAAIQNMQLGFKLGFHIYDWIKNDPYWDAIRHTPEFKREEAAFDLQNTQMLSRIKENEKKGVLYDLDISK